MLLFWNSNKDLRRESAKRLLSRLFLGGEQMERKRVGGRFVRENLDGDGGVQPAENKGAGKAPRPKHCRTFTQARVAEALPEIVKTFVEEAKKGSIAHAKMLTTLGGLDKNDVPAEAKRRRGKSTVGKLLEKMMKESEKK
jgi:hypothetical protein